MHDPSDTRNAIIQLLESLQAAGVQQLPRPRATSATTLTASVSASAASGKDLSDEGATPEGGVLLAPASAPASLGPSSEITRSVEPPASRIGISTLEVLRQEVTACALCPELATTRTQTVFGVGNPNARLCFLGEAPGADEDRLGEPFVGRAGQLLNKILEACRLKRDEVYILNVIKCRPPGNRNPLPEEAHNCRPYLEGQLEFIQPEFICCLGSVAAQNLLGTQLSIGRLRGKFHDYHGIQVLCTYHPAYLLRNPAAKKDTWEDMKLLMRTMGTPVD